MEKIAFSINGLPVTARAGESILQAAAEQGIKIPALCHHPDLKPFGACRLCLVEEEKSGRLMAACVTPAASEMAIQTHSARVENHRRNILRLLLAEHPESCVVCAKGNRCALRDYAAQLGVGLQELYRLPNPRPLEQANAFIIRDLNKCILCGKCIRADHELVVVGAIDYHHRGFRSRPAALHNQPLENSPCTFCGTCVSICPTGALTVKNSSYVGTPEREKTSVCGFCAVGCALRVGAGGEKVVDVNPAHSRATVNGSTLCVRGHFAHDFLNAGDRLTAPQIRQDGELNTVGWEEALNCVAGRLREIKDRYGPQSVALLGSSKCSNQENYLFQKMARVALGTNNVDNGGYSSGRSPRDFVEEKTAGLTNIQRLNALQKAEVIFVLGADPGESLPVVSYYLKRAARKGTPLLVADPGRNGLNQFARLRLPLAPQSDYALLHGLAAIALQRNVQDAAFIERHTEGFETFHKEVSGLDLNRIYRLTGLDEDRVQRAVDLLAGKRVAFVLGSGILQQRHAMRSLEAVYNFCLLTGSLGTAAAGIMLLARENNEIGALDMGAVPDGLPGRLPLASAAARKHWERLWQTRLSPDRGLNVVRMVEEARQGNLKALYVMGENPLRSLPQPEKVRRALEKLDLLVVQDILRTETAELADVLLPGAAFSEKAGSFTNLEGRVQSFTPVVKPPDNARADWEILDLLAARMTSAKPYGSFAAIEREISASVPSYEAGQCDEKEPAPDLEVDGPLFFGSVSLAGEDPRDPKLPFTAVLKTVRFHLGGGTRTSRSARLRQHSGDGKVALAAHDAAQLGLQDGDAVRIVSKHGQIRRQIRLDNEISPGLLFVPLACNNNDALNLVELNQLGIPEFSGWKSCRVRVEKVV